MARSSFQQKYKSKINCLLTFGKEGCYIWYGTASLPMNPKFYLHIGSHYMKYQNTLVATIETNLENIIHSIDSLYPTNLANVYVPSDNQQFRYKIAKGGKYFNGFLTKLIIPRS